MDTVPVAGRDSADALCEVTARELRQFSLLVERYSLDHPIPHGTVGDIARRLETADLPFKPSELPMIWNDRDPWGNRFRLTVDAASGDFRLWSIGPDGIDENGGGDDVLIVAHATQIGNR